MMNYFIPGVLTGVILILLILWYVRKDKSKLEQLKLTEYEAEQSAYNLIIYDDNYGRGSKHNAVNRFYPDFKGFCQKKGIVNVPAPQTLQKMLRPSYPYNDRRIIELVHEFFNKNLVIVD